MKTRIMLLFIYCITLVACANSANTPGDVQLPAGLQSLNGTQWQLIEIQSMDDSLYTPQPPAEYTLAFNALGRFSARADCNNVQGQWVHSGRSQVVFSNLISTRAMCPPESLYDRYLSDLGYVRSFILRDGNLYLSTMADGAILAFAPLPQSAISPTFSCNEAEGTVETLICQDPELIRLDLYLDELFQAGLTNFPEQDIPTYRAMQRGWISGRNDCWKEQAIRQCVIDSYSQRISELEVRTGYLLVPEATPYQCEDSVRVDAYFYSGGIQPIAVLNLDDQQVFAWLSPAASGSRYTGRNIEFWIRGEEAMLTTLGATLNCSQQP